MSLVVLLALGGCGTGGEVATSEAADGAAAPEQRASSTATTADAGAEDLGAPADAPSADGAPRPTARRTPAFGAWDMTVPLLPRPSTSTSPGSPATQPATSPSSTSPNPAPGGEPGGAPSTAPAATAPTPTVPAPTWPTTPPTTPPTTTPPTTPAVPSFPDLPGFDAAFRPPTWGPQVAVVGDSLSNSAPGLIASALYAAGAGEVRIAATPGATISDQAAALRVASVADVVVVQLGANDLFRPEGDTRTSDQVVRDALASAATAARPLVGVPCVVWVNVIRDTDLDDMRLRDEPFNAGLPSALAPLGGRARIADWYAAASQHPSWLLWDGTHPTLDGRAGLAEVIAAGVATCPSR